MAWWQYIIKTIIIIIFVVGVISIGLWGSYLIDYGKQNKKKSAKKQNVEENKTSQGMRYDKIFRWRVLKIIGLIILYLLSMSMIVITIISVLHDYNNLSWQRIIYDMLLFLGLVCVSFLERVEYRKAIDRDWRPGAVGVNTHDYSILIGLFIWFTIAGGFPYETIYEKSNDKISEWKVKSTVKNYLKENSNDGSVEIVKWHEYCVLTENKYRQQPYDYYIKVTVRLKNTYGAKVIHTFHFYLQKKSKMQVEKCDPPVSSVITFAYPNSFFTQFDLPQHHSSQLSQIHTGGGGTKGFENFHYSDVGNYNCYHVLIPYTPIFFTSSHSPSISMLSPLTVRWA